MLEQLGRFLARIHTVKVSGFGLLCPDGNGFAGSYATLWDFLWSALTKGWWLEPVLRNGLVAGATVSRIRQRFERHQHLFAIDQACLLYTDVALRKLTVD